MKQLILTDSTIIVVLWRIHIHCTVIIGVCVCVFYFFYI